MPQIARSPLAGVGKSSTRRGARAAESARLESVCGETHRGFESLSLRSAVVVATTAASRLVVTHLACPVAGSGSISFELRRGFSSTVSPIGTCVARSTRVEEDGFAGGPFVGCAGGPLP